MSRLSRAVTLIEVLIVVAVLGIIASIFVVNCTGPEVGPRAQRTLDDAGFTEIEILETGYGRMWNGCGRDDNRFASFKAVNIRGKTVYGTVCCGYAKGCTVRH